MKNKIISCLLMFFYVIFLCCVLGVTLLYCRLNDIVNYFADGALKYVFVSLYFLAVILPFALYGRTKKKEMLPLIFIVFLCFAMLCNVGISVAARSYFASFSRDKWDKYVPLRIYMTDDLAKNYVAGMREQEVIDLLGEPSNICQYNDKTFQYFVSPGLVDPVTFDITFRDGIACHAQKIEQ